MHKFVVVAFAATVSLLAFCALANSQAQIAVPDDGIFLILFDDDEEEAAIGIRRVGVGRVGLRRLGVGVGFRGARVGVGFNPFVSVAVRRPRVVIAAPFVGVGINHAAFAGSYGYNQQFAVRRTFGSVYGYAPPLQQAFAAPAPCPQAYVPPAQFNPPSALHFAPMPGSPLADPGCPCQQTQLGFGAPLATGGGCGTASLGYAPYGYAGGVNGFGVRRY